LVWIPVAMIEGLGIYYLIDLLDHKLKRGGPTQQLLK
jgi:hypothetical protein